MSEILPNSTIVWDTSSGPQKIVVHITGNAHGSPVVKDEYGQEYILDIYNDGRTILRQLGFDDQEIPVRVIPPNVEPVTPETIPKSGDILTIDDIPYKILSQEPDGYFRIEDLSPNRYEGTTGQIRTVGFVVNPSKQVYIVDKPRLANMTILRPNLT